MLRVGTPSEWTPWVAYSGCDTDCGIGEAIDEHTCVVRCNNPCPGRSFQFRPCQAGRPAAWLGLKTAHLLKQKKDALTTHCMQDSVGYGVNMQYLVWGRGLLGHP